MGASDRVLLTKPNTATVEYKASRSHMTRTSAQGLRSGVQLTESSGGDLQPLFALCHPRFSTVKSDAMKRFFLQLAGCGMVLFVFLAGSAEEPARTGPETEKRFPPLQVPAGFKATL